MIRLDEIRLKMIILEGESRVVFIVENMVEKRLRSFGHVQRRLIDQAE